MFIGSLLWSIVFLSAAGPNFKTVSLVEQDKSALKVVVFLSQKCPCSKGHVEHLNGLVKKYPNVKFYGVISEPVTTKNRGNIESYFSEERFRFPIVRDDKQVLVKKYGALKTPHVTFFKDGEVVYQGGVTNKKSFTESSKKFLEVNLERLSKGLAFKYKTGSSLGCYIRRY